VTRTSSSASAGTYWALVLTPEGAAPETVEALTNFLWEHGAVGVVEEAAVGGVSLRAFFPRAAAPPVLAGRVRGYLDELAALGLPGARGAVTVEALADVPWGDAWRAYFRPIPVGRQLLVCPPWETPEPALSAGRSVLWIEPGRAFGTGGHGSTRACLALLERALASGPVPRCLDVGCGSGILALAAARLGAATAEAIDPDPDAIAATRGNAARNGLAGRVTTAISAVEAWTGAPAPLVVANLLASAHLTLAPTLARLTASGGRLVAGGLLAHEVPVVTGAFASAGCWLAEVAEDEGWAGLLLHRGS
jgi:ribosomal protein L11 methyltransferase